MTNPARQVLTAAHPGTGPWQLARRPRPATSGFVCALLAVAALPLAAAPVWAQSAKAAKAAGVAAPTDTRLEGDREALIEQLRREREQHVREAEAALAEAGEEALRDEVVPGIRDPFTNRPSE